MHFGRTEMVDTARLGGRLVTAGAVPYPERYASSDGAGAGHVVYDGTLAAYIGRHMPAEDDRPAGAGHSVETELPPPFVFKLLGPMPVDGGEGAPALETAAWAAVEVAAESWPAAAREWMLSSTAASVDGDLPAVQWAVGPAGSGAPPHFHAEAFNLVLHGAKVSRRRLPVNPTSCLLNLAPLLPT